MTMMAFRGALLAVVEPHLGDDSGDTLEALDLLLSFEAWERLRHQQDMSVKRAQQILAASALSLLEAARARSGRARGRERRR